MRERVLRAVHELQYEPNLLARSLRSGKSYSVGFILADIANPVMATVVRGVEEVLRQDGYALFLMDSESRPEFEASSIRFVQNRRVDGLIVSLASENHQPTVDALTACQPAVVFVDRSPPPRAAGGIRRARPFHRHDGSH